MKFAFIHAEKATFPVAALCRLLGVTRQGYYAFARRPASARADRERTLRERLRALHAESRGTYGSPRLHAALRREGSKVSKRRVERALRSMGLQGRLRRRWRVTTQANPAHPVVGNSLARDVSASRPNERWVTDISYVWTDEGWCYLAAIVDLFSRAVVGWASRHDALHQAAIGGFGDGDPALPAFDRTAASLGPRLPIHERRIPHRTGGSRRCRQHEQEGQLLG